MAAILFAILNFEKQSEWLLFNANSAIFQLISCHEQVNFQWGDDEIRFVLDQHAEYDFLKC
jgi:hypothetical protein